jgi:hypothetical protein
VPSTALRADHCFAGETACAILRFFEARDDFARANRRSSAFIGGRLNCIVTLSILTLYWPPMNADKRRLLLVAALNEGEAKPLCFMVK